MGYIGRVIAFDVPVRASSFTVDAKQPITVPDPVSNVPEQPMWHVAPVRVEGDVVFPMTSDPGVKTLFRRALEKPSKNLQAGDILAEWPKGQGGADAPFARRFKGCVANRLAIKGTASERIEVTLAVMGLSVTDESVGPSEGFDLSRVISWDMVQINGISGGGTIAPTCSIREFSVEIDNNCSHNFTFNFPDEDSTFVAARSITTGRRQVTGSLSFLGTAPTQEIAKKNLVTAVPTDELVIAIVPPQNNVIAAAGGVSIETPEVADIQMKFNRVVYEWQDLSLNSGVVVSKVEWRAHGDGPGTAAAEFTL
jgi:hypothetical protein